MELEEIFKELVNSSTDKQFVQRVIKFDINANKYRIHAVVDKLDNNNKFIIIETPTIDKYHKSLVDNINAIRSFSILSQPGNDMVFTTKYSIKLNENSEDVIFYKFIEDVIRVMDREKEDLPLHAALKRIKSWVNFFKAKNSKLLSDSSQIGLFAELMTLRTLLEKNEVNDVVKIVRSWEGPKSQNQDFIFSRDALEIKCTTKNNPFAVKIQNAYQLDNTKFENLYLAVYQVKRNQNKEGETLSDAVNSIYSILENDIDAVILFEELLLEVGYLKDVEIEYVENHFTILSINIYKVDDFFPKITTLNISNEIEKVEYIVNVQNQKSISNKIENLKLK